MTQILLATHNQGKITRFRSQLATDEIEFVTLSELDITVAEPDENGSNEWENAQIKARAYFDQTGIISLAEDTGFYFVDLPQHSQPGKDVQRSAGVKTDDTPEIRFQKMTDFYINIANGLGGSAEAYFLDEYCLYDGKQYTRATGKRFLTVHNTINRIDINFPICSLYSVKSCGKHYQDLDTAEMNDFLKPSSDGARQILERLAGNI
jgi:inosine/xanthosine triphosphate pyrophosphatase family protein